MFFCLPGLLRARALLCVLVVTTLALGQGRSGIVISEVHHVSRGDGLPTYIELQNLDPFPGNPFGTDLSGATIVIQGPGGATIFNFPLAGGVFAPAYAPTVNLGGLATPGTGTITLFDPSGPAFPSLTETAIPAPALFPSPGTLDPAQSWTICVSVPGGVTGQPSTDTVLLNGGAGTCGAAAAPFTGPLTYQGGLIRGYRVDSNTFWDFIDLPDPALVALADPPYAGPPVGPSPTVNNPEMARVSGFYFGAPTNNPEDGGIPFTSQPPPVVAAGGTSGTVSQFTAAPTTGTINVVTPPGVLAWVEFSEHPYAAFRRQQDPIFDPVLPNGFLDMQMTMNGDDPFLGHPPAPTPTNPVALTQLWDLVVPSAMGPGILTIDMNVLEQVDIGFQTFQGLAPATPAEQLLRVERVLTDFQTDAAAMGSGNLTPVQIDILPPEGDLWCELIVYDGNGFSYRAKVRNWPPNPLNCTTPNLGLGSNAPGNIDVIATCFDPMSEIYVLPSMNLPVTPGTGPFFGINPDAFTWGALGAPTNIDPWHSETTVDGLYFWSFTDPSLTGLSVDAVAAQWGTTGPTGTGFTQWSPVVRVTVQ